MHVCLGSFITRHSVVTAGVEFWCKLSNVLISFFRIAGQSYFLDVVSHSSGMHHLQLNIKFAKEQDNYSVCRLLHISSRQHKEKRGD